MSRNISVHPEVRKGLKFEKVPTVLEVFCLL
jgi:hypothetical protein